MARGRKTSKTKKTNRTYKNPNGSGSVIRLSGNRRKPYAIQITLGYKLEKDKEGNLRSVAKKKYIGYFETYQEADICRLQYLTNNSSDTSVQQIVSSKKNNLHTIKEIYTSIENRITKGKSKSAQFSYTAAFKNISSIHDIAIEEIKVSDIQKIIDELIEKGKSKSTVSNIKIVCGFIFKEAIKERYIDIDLSRFIEIESIPKQKESIPFSKEEIQILWDNLSMPYVDSILIMIHTGMRINELLKLEKSMFHFEDRYLINGSKTAAGKNRIIPIPKQIQSLLKARYDTSDRFLFPKFLGAKGIASYRSDIFTKMMDTLQLNKHRPHDCRHTYMTIADDYGMPSSTLNAIVGHTGNTLAEKVYIHKSIDNLITESDKIWEKFYITQSC